MELLQARLAEREATRGMQERNASRRAQIGSGQRGDKIRTIRTQDNTVHDERTGKAKPYRQYATGDIEF